MKKYQMSISCLILALSFSAFAKETEEKVASQTSKEVVEKVNSKEVKKTEVKEIEGKTANSDNLENYKKIEGLYQKEIAAKKNESEKICKQLKTKALLVMKKYVDKYTKEMKLNEAKAIDQVMEKFEKSADYALPLFREKDCPSAFVTFSQKYERLIKDESKKLEDEVEIINKKYIRISSNQLRVVSAQGDLDTALKLKDFKENLEAQIDKKEPKEKTNAMRRCPGKVMGLRCNIYLNKKMNKTTEISKYKADSAELLRKISIPDCTVGKDYFGLHFTGYLYVPQKGEYTFTLKSDDGSTLWIDKELVVDNDGLHRDIAKDGKKKLDAGWHTISVFYIEYRHDETLSLKMAFGDKPAMEIPEKYLAH